MDLKVGFIGLGAMGYPMAACIRRGLSKSSAVHVFDVYQPSAQRFRDEFASVGPVEIEDSPRQVASKVDVVVSMVPKAQDVSQIYLDPKDGIIAATKNSSRLLIESSTIDVETTRNVARHIQEAGQGVYVDAPVSGGVPAAQKGTLSFMIGHTEPASGDSAAERLRDIIHLLGDPKKVFWCGSVGSGLAVKISNNYISCSILTLISEAMAIGVRSGVDPKLLHTVIQNSTGQSFIGDHVCPVPGVVPHAPSSNNYRLGFKTQMVLKDLSLGIDAAHKLDVKPKMAEAALEIFEKAAKDPRCIDRDGSSVYLYVADTTDQ